MIFTDLDGVLADTYSVTRKKILQLHRYDIDTLPRVGVRRFQIRVPDVPEKFIREIIYDVIVNCWDEIEPYPNVSTALKKFYLYYNYPVNIVTARKYKQKNKTKEATYSWLKKYWPDIKFNVAFKGHKEKVEYLVEQGCNIFIEDRLKNANVISDRIKKVYLVNRPWNEGRQENNNVERVDSFKEAVEKIIV